MYFFGNLAPSCLFWAQKLHERSNLRAQNTSKEIQGPKTIFYHVDLPWAPLQRIHEVHYVRYSGIKTITPIGNFLYKSAILPVLGPKIAQAKQDKGPKQERSDLMAQNTSEAI